MMADEFVERFSYNDVYKVMKKSLGIENKFEIVPTTALSVYGAQESHLRNIFSGLEVPFDNYFNESGTRLTDSGIKLLALSACKRFDERDERAGISFMRMVSFGNEGIKAFISEVNAEHLYNLANYSQEVQTAS